MRIAQDSEVRNGIEIKQTRAGQAKKVTHHAVGLPSLGQIREAIENVHRLPAGGFNHRMHLIDKSIKAVCWTRMVDFDTRFFRKQWPVLGETKIDQPALLDESGRRVARNQGLVFVERLDLPDDVVAPLYAMQYGVETC